MVFKSVINSGAAGTVSSVSVTTANGVSGSVATATTTPAITLTLGAITPSAIDGAILGATTPMVAQVQRPINTQTGTTYTLVASDQDKMVTLNNGSAITLTIPANASVPFPVGTEIDLLQLGAGQVTVAITSDTYNSYTGKTKLAGQYAGATIKKTTSVTWVLVGNLG